MNDVPAPDMDLIVRPNHRTLTLSEVMHRIAKFIEHLPSVEFVVLVRRKGDSLGQIAVCRGGSTDPSTVREMLRASLNAYSGGTVQAAEINRIRPI